MLGEGNWTSKGLQRPEFSDASGALSLSKINFECPPGWFWVGDWSISPDFRLEREYFNRRFVALVAQVS